ncbi:MAG TPA: FKBP-type peptidyl-prolyl cis-trans isomerase [Solirubrobacterales bacterium]
MRKFLAITLMLAAVLLSACGDSESTDGTETVAAPTEEKASPDSASEGKPVAEGPPEVAHPGDWAKLKRLAGQYPNLVIPSGPAPQREVVRDLKVGKGPVIGEGDFFRVRWVSYTYKDGKVLENTWRSPSQYAYGRYVPAWKQGLPGIRIGGVRQLIAPSKLAYDNGARVYVVQPLEMVVDANR